MDEGQFTSKRLDFLLDVAREYGDVASFRLGPHRIFLVVDSDLIEQVLVTDARHYIKHFGARAYKPVLGNGLVTSEGETWLRQRRLSQPAFLKQRLQAYAPLMAELTDQMLKTWKPGSDVDIHLEFSAGFDYRTSASGGIRFAELHNIAFHRSYEVLLGTDKLPRVSQKLELNAFFFGILNFFATRWHFSFRSAVND